MVGVDSDYIGMLRFNNICHHFTSRNKLQQCAPWFVIKAKKMKTYMGHEVINMKRLLFCCGHYSYVYILLNSRPFSVQKIPHSNLILLVVDTLCPCGAKQLGTGAREMPPAPCRPGAHSRRRPQKCINYHPEVNYPNSVIKTEYPQTHIPS